MSAALELRDVTAGYREGAVLRNLTLSVAAGERVAILGPNGAGKTTLLRVLTGLHPAASGEVRLCGHEVRRLRALDRARLVAVVPQSLETPMAYTVEEMVWMGRTASLGRWASPSEAEHAAVERALEETNTRTLRGRLYAELSGGERQRVAIAMALAQEPQVILLDEPTAHLDMGHRMGVLNLMERLNTAWSVTVLMTSHDVNLASEYFPRLVLLDHGRLAADGPPETVLQADILHAVYGCEVRVRRDADGGWMVRPARRPLQFVDTSSGDC